MDAEYQESHRQFVSGHNGSEPVELLLLGVPLHSSQLLLIGLSQLLGLDYSSVVGGVLEWAVLVVPTLLGLTILADFTLQLSIAMLALALTSLLVSHFHSVRVPSQSQGPAHSKRSCFLSNHRGLMILFTTVGILAVDFPVLPR